MSSRLTHRDHDHVLKAIEELHACRELEKFPGVVCEIFQRLIGCDTVSYNEVYPSIERSVAAMVPPLDNIEVWMSKWTQHAHQHPVINYCRKTGDGSAHQIADFLSTRQYHALDLYQEIYRDMKVEYQMAVVMNAPMDIIIGVAMNREQRRFSETSRLLSNRLRPHLTRAYLNLVELRHLTALVDGLSGALEETGAHVVLWSHREVVLFASAQARDALNRYFGWRDGRHLPEKVAAWAKARLSGRATPDTLKEEGRDGRLTVRLSPRPEFHYTTLIFDEAPRDAGFSRLRSLGLSQRQTEVMAWLAEGKSNEEIGIILGMNPLTVKTHVRDILRKLGVENRTTAAARALEAMSARGRERHVPPRQSDKENPPGAILQKE